MENTENIQPYPVYKVMGQYEMAAEEVAFCLFTLAQHGFL